MGQQDVEETIVQMLATILNQSPVDVQAQLAANEGACDSLVGVELILAIEESFGISVPDDALSDVCRSIPALVEFVTSRVSQEDADNHGGSC